MAKNDYYTFKSDPQDPNHFTVIIRDKDFEPPDPPKQYEIHGSTCDCWAGHKWCRHKQMLVMFKKEGKINSNQFYNFDKETWLAQPSLEI